MQREKRSDKEVKDKKEILREEKAKREIKVRQAKIEKTLHKEVYSATKGQKKEKLLREVVVKIGLKQEEKEEEIVIEVLLDSGATELVL